MSQKINKTCEHCLENFKNGVIAGQAHFYDKLKDMVESDVLTDPWIYDPENYALYIPDVNHIVFLKEARELLQRCQNMLESGYTIKSRKEVVERIKKLIMGTTEI